MIAAQPRISGFPDLADQQAVGVHGLRRFTEYCDRPFDSAGRTCKKIGALRLWEKKKKENPAFRAYSKAYKKRFAWIKYGKITQEAFYEWSEQARKMREQCASGKISLEDFNEWLEE